MVSYVRSCRAELGWAAAAQCYCRHQVVCSRPTKEWPGPAGADTQRGSGARAESGIEQAEWSPRLGTVGANTEADQSGENVTILSSLSKQKGLLEQCLLAEFCAIPRKTLSDPINIKKGRYPLSQRIFEIFSKHTDFRGYDNDIRE